MADQEEDQGITAKYAHESDLLQPIGKSRMVGDEIHLFDDGVYKAGVSGFSMNNRKSIRYLHHDDDGNPIGALQIMTEGPRSKKAVIQNVYVAEPFRRSKIATGLLNRARQDFDVKHSKDLTASGRAFAKSVKADGGSVEDGITAYHGSPHKFDRFDLSKIGTGEGAQAYGHGLYFAESEPVAKGYRDQLKQDFAFVDGEKIPHPSEENPDTNLTYTLANHLYQMGWNVDQAIDFANKHAESLKADLESENQYKRGKAEHAQKWAKDIAPFKGKKVEWKQDPGHMYEVSINAHPDHFLDWDKPLSEQHELLQQKIYDHMLDNNFEKSIVNHILNNKTGQDLYNELVGRLSARNPSPESGAEKASNFLKTAGIKGIKYLDAGSRGKGDGTRNYVVFDDKLVNVKRRYARGGRIGYADGGSPSISDRIFTFAETLPTTEENIEYLKQFGRNVGESAYDLGKRVISGFAKRAEQASERTPPPNVRAGERPVYVEPKREAPPQRRYILPDGRMGSKAELDLSNEMAKERFEEKYATPRVVQENMPSLDRPAPTRAPFRDKLQRQEQQANVDRPVVLPERKGFDWPQVYKDIMSDEPQMEWTKGMTPRERGPRASGGAVRGEYAFGGNPADLAGGGYGSGNIGGGSSISSGGSMAEARAADRASVSGYSNDSGGGSSGGGGGGGRDSSSSNYRSTSSSNRDRLDSDALRPGGNIGAELVKGAVSNKDMFSPSIDMPMQFGMGVRQAGFPTQQTGPMDPRNQGYAEQMAKSAREAYLQSTRPIDPTSSENAYNFREPFVGGISDERIAEIQRQLNEPIGQPMGPVKPQAALPDSAFGRTLIDPTGKYTQDALGQMQVASDGINMLNSPTLAGAFVRAFTPTPTPATPQQQAAIERMYRRDLNTSVPANFATPEGMAQRYGAPGATPLARPGQTSTAYLNAGPSASTGRQDMPVRSASTAPSPSSNQTPKQNFEKAFSEARARGDETFSWTNPKTGQTMRYTTKLQRKSGGRVPSISEHEQWEYKEK